MGVGNEWSSEACEEVVFLCVIEKLDLRFLLLSGGVSWCTGVWSTADSSSKSGSSGGVWFDCIHCHFVANLYNFGYCSSYISSFETFQFFLVVLAVH